jgi:hypothetical protein
VKNVLSKQDPLTPEKEFFAHRLNFSPITIPMSPAPLAYDSSTQQHPKRMREMATVNGRPMPDNIDGPQSKCCFKVAITTVGQS